MDLNTEAPVVDRAPPTSTPDTSVPRERPSVRDTIRQSFADARQRDEAPIKSEEEDIDTSTQDAATTDRDADSVSDRDTDTGIEASADAGKEEDRDAAVPTSWAKEAKDIWNDVPERARAEIAKREKDMEKGVKSLKEKYKEVDEALAPYLPVIQEFGKTPGQAVGQLFAWFDALAKNPDEAFPALVDSYKYDKGKLVDRFFPGARQRYAQMEQYIKNLQQQQTQQAQPGQQPNGQAQPNGQQQPPVHPQIVQYIQQLQQEIGSLKNQVTQHDQHFGGLANYYEQQNTAKTQEMLERWAESKPHFNDVRIMMGHLLTPDPNTGIAAIPLKDGKVDLDAAYEAAIYAMPEVRSRILAEQRTQEAAARKAKADAALKAQQDKAAAAQRASGSLTSSAPGAEVGRATKPSKGLSVRESLQQAMKELSDR